MTAVCSKNMNHKAFITVAHVTEDWKVDPEGEFISVHSGGEVTHRPDPGNSWNCAICGAEAEHV